jgi:hypothetical protein
MFLLIGGWMRAAVSSDFAERIQIWSAERNIAGRFPLVLGSVIQMPSGFGR